MIAAQPAIAPDAAARRARSGVFQCWKHANVLPIYNGGAGEWQAVGRTRHLGLASFSTDHAGETSLLQSRIFVQRTQS